jgi:hypothetical protein
MDYACLSAFSFQALPILFFFSMASKLSIKSNNLLVCGFSLYFCLIVLRFSILHHSSSDLFHCECTSQSLTNARVFFLRHSLVHWCVLIAHTDFILVTLKPRTALSAFQSRSVSVLRSPLSSNACPTVRSHSTDVRDGGDTIRRRHERKTLGHSSE